LIYAFHIVPAASIIPISHHATTPIILMAADMISMIYLSIYRCDDYYRLRDTSPWRISSNAFAPTISHFADLIRPLALQIS